MAMIKDRLMILNVEALIEQSSPDLMCFTGRVPPVSGQVPASQTGVPEELQLEPQSLHCNQLNCRKHNFFFFFALLKEN